MSEDNKTAKEIQEEIERLKEAIEEHWKQFPNPFCSMSQLTIASIRARIDYLEAKLLS